MSIRWRAQQACEAAQNVGTLWLIFRTGYGLIPPDTLIERHDQSAGDARRSPEFRRLVAEQAETLLAEATEIVVVGSENQAMFSLLRDLLPDLAHLMRLGGDPAHGA